MLHDATRGPTQRPPPTLSEPQFLSIEIAPAIDGSLWVSSTGTYVDEAKLEFINDEIEHIRVGSLDDAMSVIRRIVSDTLLSHRKERH